MDRRMLILSQLEALLVTQPTNERPGLWPPSPSRPRLTIPFQLVSSNALSIIVSRPWSEMALVSCIVLAWPVTTLTGRLEMGILGNSFHLRLNFGESLVIYRAINKFTPWLLGILSSHQTWALASWSVFTCITHHSITDSPVAHLTSS